ncbi:hypothetical protein ACFY12_20985 [Streptomyces sp. NPDC001339]|uniref:hypothetical protein n=1 Tax=Streptomyces sp. NPDC001339 TaxID=3364563 RepID=UPI00367B719A
MPIYLPAPAPTRPADGKGYNRLTLNAHMGAGGAQCALQPKSWATLYESYDTRRARWGGFGLCIRNGDCNACPVFTASLHDSGERAPFNAPRVLIRIETTLPDDTMFAAQPVTALWMTDRPDAPDYRTHGQKWTWLQLTRLRGWELGRRYRDQIGPGFWMLRTPYAPAPHVEVRTQARASLTRHAFMVGGTRAALLACYGRCRHDDGTLLNVIGHHTPGTVDDENLTLGRWQPTVPAGIKQGRHLRREAHRGSARLALYEGRDRLATLSFTGSQWDAEQIHAAETALLDRTGR